MNTLDALLYQWVGEADESRIECAFQAYYSTAFPALVRYVQHRTGWDRGSAEDISQEALVRFFERAGRGRRAAAALVGAELQRLNSIRIDGLDADRVALWACEVKAFMDAVSNFRPPSPVGPTRPGRSGEGAGDLCARIMPLQSRGWGLLEEARQTLQSRIRAGATDVRAFPSVRVAQPDAQAAADLTAREIESFVGGLSRGCAREVDAGQYMQCVLTIITTLPRLRVPTNGFLFEIATNTLLDEVKRRRRRKRGGIEGRLAATAASDCQVPDMTAHPIEAVPDDPQSESDDGAWLRRDPPVAQHVGTQAEALPLAGDPLAGYEGEEFLERFHEYLRRPVAQAVSELALAMERGSALVEQRRLESVSRKFSRTMAVLTMMGEGYTQEEAARRAGITRNQVKYIIGSVKEAYLRFAADERREPHPRILREGESHAS